MPAELLEAARRAAQASEIAGLWFPKCAHVVDPLEVVRAFAADAAQHGACVIRRNVRSLVMRGDSIEVVSGTDTVVVSHAIICAGAWSAALLHPFGLKVPLEAARGYHVEMPGAKPIIDAPRPLPGPGHLRHTHGRPPAFHQLHGIRRHGRARRCAPSGAVAAHADRARLSRRCAADELGGPRPVLPDYLPAIGRVPGAANVMYAFGHQHIGLTLSAVTANTIADLVASRPLPAHVAAFDLRRFQ